MGFQQASLQNEEGVAIIEEKALPTIERSLRMVEKALLERRKDRCPANKTLFTPLQNNGIFSNSLDI
ncbi:hypothetical protein [Planococcus chinensis]|uniref:Uncharacterized protein n=1 Tax=Planococcus chinensis TaxID=272917 RepID=A0ABW4QHS6_9BACL